MSHQRNLLDTAGNVVTSGKLALPTLMMNLSPVVGGLVLASILAAILSTVSPLILASGTMVTKDLYQGVFRPNATDAQVLDIVYFAYSLRGSLFVIVLLGIYWKKTSQRGAIYGIICTGIVGAFWVIYNSVTGHFPIHPAITETYASVATAFVTTILFTKLFPKEKTLVQQNAVQ